MAGNQVFQVLVDEEKLKEMNSHVERQKLVAKRQAAAEAWLREDQEHVRRRVAGQRANVHGSIDVGGQNKTHMSVNLFDTSSGGRSNGGVDSVEVATHQIASLVGERDSIASIERRPNDEMTTNHMPGHLGELHRNDMKHVNYLYNGSF